MKARSEGIWVAIGNLQLQVGIAGGGWEGRISACIIYVLWRWWWGGGLGVCLVAIVWNTLHMQNNHCSRKQKQKHYRPVGYGLLPKVPDVRRCDCLRLCACSTGQRLNTLFGPLFGCSGRMSVLCEITGRCWIMMKPAVNITPPCEFRTISRDGHLRVRIPDEAPNLGSFWWRQHTGRT